MTVYLITPEAIDHAAEAIRDGLKTKSIWDLARAALEAAAPLIERYEGDPVVILHEAAE